MLFLKELNFIEGGLRTLAAWLCETIYSLIALLFDLFMNISKVRIMENTQEIFERLTMILAIVMVFYVTFEFVKFVIEPAGISDKEKGASKIVFKMVAVVLLIAFVPKIFSGAYLVQDKIIESQVFSKVILGKVDTNNNYRGRAFSVNLLSMFYYVDETVDKNAQCGSIKCTSVVAYNLNQLAENGNTPALTYGINYVDSSDYSKPYITFEALLALGVGIFVLYVLILYCIDVGVRVIQLAFLEIIAPIPIIGYLAPKKDGMFQKWVKQCITTYLDLFIRLAIINFVLLITEILYTAFRNNTFLNLPNVSGTMKVFIYVALIMGLLLFANKAPKMLKELFPSTGSASGNFGLKAGERVAPMAARAIGAGLGGANSLVRRGIGRAANTMRRNKRERERLAAEGKTFAEAKKERRQNAIDLKKSNERMRQAFRNTQRKNMSAEDRKTATEVYNKERNKNIQLRSQVADDRNRKPRSAVLQGLAGAATGAVSGAKTGLGATKLEDINKKVKEGTSRDKEALASRESWLDAGGGSFIDRTRTNIEKRMGITTETGRIQQEIEDIADTISANEALISNEKEPQSYQGKAEDRLKKKLLANDLKTTLGESEVKYVTGKVPGAASALNIRAGEKATDILQRARSSEEQAKFVLDSAIKTNGEGSAEAIAAKAKYDEYSTIKQQLEKHLTIATFTRTMNNPDLGEIDATTKEILDTMKSKIEVAKMNEETIIRFKEKTRTEAEEKLNRTRKQLIAQGADEATIKNQLEKISKEYEEQMRLFETLSFEIDETTDYRPDHDMLDSIVTRLTNISETRSRENMQYKEMQRMLKESSATAAAKADDQASGGKK